MKKYFITGLLIWIPLVITLWVLNLIVSTMDSTLLLLPESLQPKWHIPGLGALLTLLVLLLTGVFAANIIGQRLVRVGEGMVARIPVVKTIYNSVKQVSDTLFSSRGQAFRKALLVRFPHSDAWTVAFLTGTPSGEVADKLGSDRISVYVPTTPNPTSGYFLIVPRSEVIDLDLSVDEALKYVISMGVASPTPQRRAATRNVAPDA
ncbi:MAG TPA: DUF502 domain-containing protein [Burkholderiales bacterium]|nr:DUF502 domain-containing protein [Burkholderiales bacterium]